ncbi:unnamed protein product [Boreogadus saida]
MRTLDFLDSPKLPPYPPASSHTLNLPSLTSGLAPRQPPPHSAGSWTGPPVGGVPGTGHPAAVLDGRLRGSQAGARCNPSPGPGEAHSWTGCGRCGPPGGTNQGALSHSVLFLVVSRRRGRGGSAGRRGGSGSTRNTCEGGPGLTIWADAAREELQALVGRVGRLASVRKRFVRQVLGYHAERGTTCCHEKWGHSCHTVLPCPLGNWTMEQVGGAPIMRARDGRSGALAPQAAAAEVGIRPGSPPPAEEAEGAEGRLRGWRQVAGPCRGAGNGDGERGGMAGWLKWEVKGATRGSRLLKRRVWFGGWVSHDATDWIAGIRHYDYQIDKPAKYSM